MVRRIILSTVVIAAAGMCLSAKQSAAQEAYGRQWGGTYTTQDWNRFYHYPYVYYPQNFWGSEYYRSADSLYYRYPPEMRIPVYNRRWHNYYPNQRTRYYDGLLHTRTSGARYLSGKHFNLDVF